MENQEKNILIYANIAIKIFAFSSVIFCLTWAKIQLINEQNFFSRIHNVEINIPKTPPRINQDSIDFAMTLFGIKTPPNILGPDFDDTIEDRGITSKGTLSETAWVKIGSAAFSDWSILGSTLAHEIEVHGRQNFFMIWVLDSLGFDGTGHAEREAYSYELYSADRFGLGYEDLSMIEDTMHYYYPENTPFTEKIIIASEIKRWIKKNLFKKQDPDI
ncbi:MAG: hypothetical protein R3B45_09155 [Bdellovibrionota bacterium]